MSSVRRSVESKGIDWLAVVRIVLVQIFVLFALSGAIIGYLDWSSKMAWKEFTAVSKQPAAQAAHRPQHQTFLQSAKSQRSRIWAL
jgi:hypothetical protein